MNYFAVSKKDPKLEPRERGEVTREGLVHGSRGDGLFFESLLSLGQDDIGHLKFGAFERDPTLDPKPIELFAPDVPGSYL